MLDHSQNNPTMPGRSRIVHFLSPSPFLESSFEVTAPRFERERALPLEISENRPLYFCLPLCGYGRGKWTGAEREESQPDREINARLQHKEQRKIKCFSLLLGSWRCAGLVTLATGNGAEHLIGVCACECVCVTCRGRSRCSNGESMHSLLTDLEKAAFLSK